jgi:hypothetical protein
MIGLEHLGKAFINVHTILGKEFLLDSVLAMTVAA